MHHTIAPSRRTLLLGAAASTALPVWQARAQSISVLNIATTGDPGPLDPTPVTSDMLSEITQLFYETLYIFAPDFGIAPLLAAALPEISDGGKRYVIKLRSGVPYHDGSTMNADDVVASLQRWGRLSPRGRTPWAFQDSISAKDTLDGRDRAEAALFTAGQPAGIPERLAADHAEARCHGARSAEGLYRHRSIQADRVQARYLGARRKIRAICFPTGHDERVCRPARGAGGRDPVPPYTQSDHACGWSDGGTVSLGGQSDPGKLRRTSMASRTSYPGF